MLTNGFEGAMIINVASKSAFSASLVILAELIPAYFSFIIFGEHLFLTKYSWNDIQPDLVCTSVLILSSVGNTISALIPNFLAISLAMIDGRSFFNSLSCL